MSNKDKILEVLHQEELTSSEIADKTDIDINQIYVYLNNMLKAKKIKRITNKKPYLYAVREEKEEIYKHIIEKLIPGLKQYKPDIDFTEREFDEIKKLMRGK